MSTDGIKSSVTLSTTGDVAVRKLQLEIKHLEEERALNLTVIKGETMVYKAIPNEPGGEFKWTASGGISVANDGEGYVVVISGDSSEGDSALKVEYSLNGVKAVKKLKINVLELKVAEAPEYFAPTAEDCLIKFNCGSPGLKVDDPFDLVIRDKEGKVIIQESFERFDSDENMEYNWNGKDQHGNYINFYAAPFKASIELKDRPETRSEEREIKLEIESMELKVEGVEEVKIGSEQFKAVDMTVANRALEVAATVKLKASDGSGMVTELPFEIYFSFLDSSGENLKESDSVYAYKHEVYLGKVDSESARYWRSHVNYPVKGEFVDKTTFYVKVNQKADHEDLGAAKVNFLPSAAGGDHYILKAAVLGESGQNDDIIHQESADEFVIIRRVKLDIYEMEGQYQLAEEASEKNMHKFFTKDTYVLYEIGEVKEIKAQYCGKYIGLWDSQKKQMADWDKIKKKLPAETPTPVMEAALGDPAHSGHADAMRKLKAMGEAWMKRILDAYDRGIRNWAADAGIPERAIIEIDCTHPKLNAYSLNADAITGEWEDYPEFTVKYDSRDVYPDKRWSNALGLSREDNVYILAGMDVMGKPLDKIIAHEIAHETRWQFAREEFGGRGDHSVEAGLMDPHGTKPKFTTKEKKVLRGYKK